MRDAWRLPATGPKGMLMSSRNESWVKGKPQRLGPMECFRDPIPLRGSIRWNVTLLIALIRCWTSWPTGWSTCSSSPKWKR